MLGGQHLILVATYTVSRHDALTHILGQFDWCPVERLSSKSRLWHKVLCNAGLITQRPCSLGSVCADRDPG